MKYIITFLVILSLLTSETYASENINIQDMFDIELVREKQKPSSLLKTYKFTYNQSDQTKYLKVSIIEINKKGLEYEIKSNTASDINAKNSVHVTLPTVGSYKLRISEVDFNTDSGIANEEFVVDINGFRP